MSLKHAILGFLAIGPETGYELKKRFDRTVGGFWHADQSRIYRTLDSLLEEDLVSQGFVAQSGRPDRKPYQITERGREALLRWLKDSHAGSPHRNEFLIQLFFAGLLDDEEAVQVLKEKRSRILRTLGSFEGRYSLDTDYEYDEPVRVDFYQWLTLDSAVHMRYALIAWIDNAIARIERGDSRKGREGAITRWPPYNDPAARSAD